MKRKLLSLIIVCAMLLSFIPDLKAEAAGGWHIYVNTQSNVVTIYKNGAAVKSLICSAGRAETATPHGTFRLSGRARWGHLLNSAGQYTNRIVGSVLFHSVPCARFGDAGSVYTADYDILGQNASHGCVRLNVEGAKYIYDNCPDGTPVTVMASSSTGPLGKPKNPKIGPCPSPFRDWDPTDRWSAGNPWFTNKTYLGSAVFDPVYYRNKYADLRSMNDTFLKVHWIAYGIKEGRQASADFNVNYYKSANADLRRAYGSNNFKYLAHFVNYGKKEGRLGALPAFGPTLNTSFYAAKYTDLRRAFGSNAEKLTKHYESYGLSEGRQGSAVFNISTYKKNNADLVKAFGNDNEKYIKHFNEYGMKEGRKSSDTFDVYSYKYAYQDLRLAFGNDLAKYYEHYNRYGYNEGRKATGTKSVKNAVTKMNGVDYSSVYDYYYYTSRYPDIKKAFGNDDIATLQHFVNYGMKEGRQAKPDFNLNAYRSRYIDLRRAFGSDNKQYYLHYINYGKKEGRIAK